MPSSEFKRLFKKDKNLSFNLFLMQVSNEDALKVLWFSHTCEKPKSSKTFLTKFSHRLFTSELLSCSQYASDIRHSLLDWTVCNQKLIQLAISEIIKGNWPSSLYTPKLDAFECTPRTYLENTKVQS